MNLFLIIFAVHLQIILNIVVISAETSPWRYECVKGYCEKRPNTNSTENTALSLSACRIFCADSGALWPKPNGETKIGTFLTTININSIDVLGVNYDSPIFELVKNASKIFTKQIELLIPRNLQLQGGKSLVVNLDITNHSIDSLTMDLDESYTLNINESSDGRILANITALNFFGARHGLETLNQLIIYDDLRDELQIARDVSIKDQPAYPYRGILLDTARNFITVDAIKRTLTAMGAAKLNTFHWHITDSHSFPYQSKSRPDLSKFGAYSREKVYSPEDIEEIITFGKQRGIRVLPEFDAPAHVGEGWQNSGLVTCFNSQPWQNYCVEPPCGQFDVTQPELYNAIADIYNDMFDQFKPDIFHMGGDEVNFNCWNSTESIVEWMATNKGWGRTEADFVKLWNYFQTQALEKVYQKAGKSIPIVMWTSHLTQNEYLETSLPKDKYIIQIWTKGDDEQVQNLLDKGYQVILSNYDALYFDCGYSGWVTDGNNWCAPYIGWQKVYENKPRKIAGFKLMMMMMVMVFSMIFLIAGDKVEQVLGAEAALWTEQVDSTSVDSRLWPRASAMAEVLWSDPLTSWRDAERRFLIHRERLVKLGIQADALEPEWCMQYEENCPIGGKFNVNNTS